VNTTGHSFVSFHT